MKEISAYIRSVCTYYRIDRYLKLYNVTKKTQITQESNHSLYECFASNMRYHWHYILGNINIIYMNVITRIYFFLKEYREISFNSKLSFQSILVLNYSLKKRKTSNKFEATPFTFLLLLWLCVAREKIFNDLLILTNCFIIQHYKRVSKMNNYKFGCRWTSNFGDFFFQIDPVFFFLWIK